MKICPCCLQSDSSNLGDIPPSNLFAGRKLPHVLAGGSLLRCNHCGLGYRYPRMSTEELNELYIEGTVASWDYGPTHRRDWDLAKKIISAQFTNNPRVLDVGCFDGRFLAELQNAQRYGVEISAAGSEKAKQRNITIVGSDYKRIETKLNFDVVTAFDVLEHVDDPKGFIRLFSEKLRDGGLLIISTGNLDAWSWQIAKSRYWYCAFPEHITFLSHRWFNWIAKELELDLKTSSFSHGKTSPIRTLREAAINVLYLFAPGITRFLRALGLGEIDASDQPEMRDYPPGWLSAKDHLLVVFEKPATPRNADMTSCV